MQAYGHHTRKALHCGCGWAAVVDEALMPRLAGWWVLVRAVHHSYTSGVRFRAVGRVFKEWLTATLSDFASQGGSCVTVAVRSCARSGCASIASQIKGSTPPRRAPAAPLQALASAGGTLDLATHCTHRAPRSTHAGSSLMLAAWTAWWVDSMVVGRSMGIVPWSRQI